VIACNAFALILAVAGQNALAQRRSAIRNVRVDVSPLRATAGITVTDYGDADYGGITVTGLR
jgi:hypothetical protein